MLVCVCGAVCQWSECDCLYVCGLQATDSMKVSMTQAHFERNLAVQQVTRLKQEIDQLGRDRHAVCLHFYNVFFSGLNRCDRHAL